MIENKIFEDKVHEILKEKGLKIQTTIVPPSWRPKDMVIKVSKLIEQDKHFHIYHKW